MRLSHAATFVAIAVTSFVSGVAAPAAAQVIWIGPEIPLNAVTAGSQFAPAIATAADGGFVAAWQGGDADGFGVRARRFNSDGTPATGEFAVNSTTAGDQISPAVAILDASRIVVVWASNGQGGDTYEIVARIFLADGSPASGEIAVNSTTAGNQSAPSVERQLSGGPQAGFVVLWTGPNPVGDTNEIWARSFSGTLGALSADFRVNATVSGHQLTPALLRLADDTFVAAWSSEGQDGSGYGVYARRFASNGTLLTAEIPVPEITTLDQLSPALAEVAGGFVVAWQRSLQATIQQVGPQPIVAFRRFDTAGAPLSDEVPVNADTAVRHERPALAGDAGGGFTVAWRESRFDPDDRNVVGARFDGAGLPTSGAFTLNTTTAGDQIDPELAAGALAGRFVAAWSSFGQDGSSFGVFAQRFGEPCAPCTSDDTTLCFHDDRFRVTASFATAGGASGNAQAVGLTDESGFFTFFDPENVELVVKAVDACGLAGFENFWIFATGLTNVEVTLTAEDTQTCEARVYHNDLYQAFQPILDTTHFQVCGAGALVSPAESASAASSAPLFPAPMAGAGGGCVADDHTVCLLDGRFAATIDYETALPSSGQGHAVALTPDSGYFWFFDDANVELVIKMVDGCSFNDRYWVYAGGLTDVGTHLRVRDTLNPDAAFEYVKAIGPPFPPIQSIEAFATCP